MPEALTCTSFTNTWGARTDTVSPRVQPHYPNHPPPPFPQPYGAHPNAAPPHPAYYPAAPGPAHPPPPPPPQQQQPPQTPPGTSHVHEATTVRNLVNLKKATLKLSPRAGSPHILDIAFTLDVVTECRCACVAWSALKFLLHGANILPEYVAGATRRVCS